jgi:alpha-amylase/alpha-mannosidase (GH57 family)
MSAERYICIHGHFYQPPRENAWLESVEWQDSAYPYHDWNERVTAECYLPNTSSRILDGEGNIDRIVSNYAKISFDFGPTLLDWLQKNEPEVHEAIIEADRQSRASFSGHGSAMAQAYNHIIMPLANHRDRYTQVVWGIRDFERRFGRKPEGMWLPETAVDYETLDIMAGLGITYTVLAPHQAAKVRRIGASSWKDVSHASIDTTRAYIAELPSGRHIKVFIYNGPLSNGVAFEDILKNGETFARRLTGAFSDKSDHPQIVHIATDGETYGHHQRFADMALAFALNYIETNKTAKITNYGEFLEKFPPTHEVKIIEKTSWSCVHGVDRWWSDCGDTTGTGNHPGWNQKWRTPLRNALDMLRDTFAPRYEEKARQLFKDPWAARDGYIDVILDRSTASVTRFFEKYESHALNSDEKVMALKLLELQRHAMLMYTSCGWFFDEISRPEPIQVIQYAGRVVQLAQELFDDDIEANFLYILEQAKSNIPEQSDGRRIYERMVVTAMINLTKVAAHYAINSLFEKYSEDDKIYSYYIKNEGRRDMECGKTRVVTGRARVTSEITGESGIFNYGVLNLGGHAINAGVRPFQDEQGYQSMAQEFSQTCASNDVKGVMRLLEKYFGGSTYTLESLFRDEQRDVLDHILKSTMTEIDEAYRQLYEHYYPPMRLLSELGGPVPRAFHSAAELILNIDLHREIDNEVIDTGAIKDLVNTAATWKVELDTDGIGYDLKEKLETMASVFMNAPDNIDRMRNVLDAVTMARSLPFPVDLWKAQNIYWNLLQSVYPAYKQAAGNNDTKAITWVEIFTSLGKNLSVRIE